MAQRPPALLALCAFLESLSGGSASLVVGWTTRTAQRKGNARGACTYWYSETGTKFRSRLEALPTLRASLLCPRAPPLTPRAPFAQVAQHFGLDVPAQPPASSSSHGRKRRAPVASFAPPRQQQLARETRHEAGCDSASECGSASATASTADAADCQLSDVEPSSPRKRRPSVGC